jgi:hypothetical protein
MIARKYIHKHVLLPNNNFGIQRIIKFYQILFLIEPTRQNRVLNTDSKVPNFKNS